VKKFKKNIKKKHKKNTFLKKQHNKKEMSGISFWLIVTEQQQHKSTTISTFLPDRKKHFLHPRS